jgi:hypothetical protein
LLEGSVQEAQESESHILEFQEWVTHVDALLTARVENDLTADDLPDDDQVCVTTLFTLLTGSEGMVSVFISQQCINFFTNLSKKSFIFIFFVPVCYTQHNLLH